MFSLIATCECISLTQQHRVEVAFLLPKQFNVMLRTCARLEHYPSLDTIGPLWEELPRPTFGHKSLYWLSIGLRPLLDRSTVCICHFDIYVQHYWSRRLAICISASEFYGSDILERNFVPEKVFIRYQHSKDLSPCHMMFARFLRLQLDGITTL